MDDSENLQKRLKNMSHAEMIKELRRRAALLETIRRRVRSMSRSVYRRGKYDL